MIQIIKDQLLLFWRNKKTLIEKHKSSATALFMIKAIGYRKKNVEFSILLHETTAVLLTSLTSCPL